MIDNLKINIELKIDLLLYPVKHGASDFSESDGPIIDPIMTSKIAPIIQMSNRFWILND